MNRRKAGRMAAALLALGAFACAGWAAYASSIPQVRVYDGYWMILGSTLAVVVLAPVVWRWPRERSLVAIAIATIVGSVAPLGISAIRHHIPIMARLRGSWILAGADVVGPALVIGFVCLWFAVREHQGSQPPGARDRAG
jgi:hypothetical protein